MLEITNLRDGAVLDHRNGIETDDCLEIEVAGLASSQAIVKVNGEQAQKCDRFFTAKVKLTGQINEIVATASDAFGEYTQKITVAWDKKSFRRYNFFFDDCCFFLRDITKDRPASIFDEMFLNRLKSIHDKYGTKFTLNLFYRDDHHKDFCLADMPDTYKTEFKQNSNWLRMSFHAKSEFPDRPYQGASDAALAADFDLVKAEIIRFAGEQSFIVPLVIHWGMTNPGNFHVLQERGVKMLTGGFLGCATYIGESHTEEVSDIGYFYEKDITIYLMKASRFYDRRKKLFLMSNLCCCNLTEQPGLLNAFKELERNPHDTLSLMTHEQYSFPDYFNYLPDHMDRVELVCRLATEAGCKPVWFAENMAGNPAWY